ncbi:amidohydrolase, partial [Candidatus Symbiopectobacterium sp. NZEC135]|nr:amidohydrolase [Candidatus Symbiopectobacterium sp. NZEC135]
MTPSAPSTETPRVNKATVETLLPELTALRRQIHQHPEIGFEEWQTARLIASTLTEWGIEVT